jgi:hypothetical protein
MTQITSNSAKMFIGAMLAAGIAVLGRSVMVWGSDHHMWLLYLAVLAVIASRLRVSLPGIDGSMSMNLPFILLAMSRLSFSEAVLIAGLSTLAQSLPRQGGHFKLVQAAFNTCNIMFAVALGFWASHADALSRAAWSQALLPVVACATYFVAQTIPVATVISLTENKSALHIWREIATLSFPYFVLSAGVGAIALGAMQHLSFGIPLAALAVMFFVYRSYSRYFRTAVAGPVDTRAMSAAAAR